MPGVEVRLLGPVQVVGPAGPAALPGSRQRGVVALLALRPGVVIARARLIDAVWGRDPPRTAVKTLHSHIARIRQALAASGLPGCLSTRDHGYALELAPELVDACRFEEQVRQGQARLARADPGGAAAILRAGLALWRGEPAEDIELAGWGAAELGRLRETRLAALTDLWDAELRQGHHEPAARELERLLVTYPTRERLVGLLMLARYRCGWHAAALEAYLALRAALAEELGVDPGPELQALYTAVLRRDPALDPPRPAPPPADPSPSDPSLVDRAATGRAATGRAGAGRAAADLAAPDAAADGRASGGRPGIPAAPGRAQPEPGFGGGEHALNSPNPQPAPAQLPAPVGYFTGRTGELRTLDRVLAEPGGEPRIAVISGAAGMGKTALAVQWAHRVWEHFVDGQLFLDVRGHDRQSVLAPAEILAHLLRGLGVPADRVPADLTERTSLYRSLVHDKRVLVVLDNAGEVADVLPVVPSGAAGMLLVTSRARLAGLAAHHAVRPIGLDVLSPDEAVALLERALGADRAAGEPASVRRLAQLCDQLPLALRIAAAKLAARPRRPISDAADELAAADRLGALAVDGDSRSVRAVFASAYRALSPPAARLFRLLSLHPGVNASAHLAAAAGAVPLAAARRAIDELAAAHLLVEVDRERYRSHDLIQLFAGERAQADETPRGRDQAAGRIVDWYLTVAAAANKVIDPGRDRVTVSVAHPPAELPFGRNHQDALAFLDQERDNLVLVVRAAAEHGRHTAAWQLTYLLTGFFDSRGHWQERLGMCQWGVVAASREGDPAAEGLMRSGLGVACIMTRRFEEALTHFAQALTLMRAAGDKRGEGHLHNNIAVALTSLRRFEEAVDAHRRALAVHEASGYRLGQALTLNNMGDVYVLMGEVSRGVTHLFRSLAISRQLDNHRLEALARSSLGQGALRRGAHREALEHLHRALALRRQAGDRRYAAQTCNDLGSAHLQAGDPAAAADWFGQALALSGEIADQHVAAVARYRLGLALLAAGDPAAARASFELALLLRRQVPDPYEEANLHRALGDLAHAARDLATAQRQWWRAIEKYRRSNATGEADEVATRFDELVSGIHS